MFIPAVGREERSFGRARRPKGGWIFSRAASPRALPRRKRPREVRDNLRLHSRVYFRTNRLRSRIKLALIASARSRPPRRDGQPSVAIKRARRMGWDISGPTKDPRYPHYFHSSVDPVDTSPRFLRGSVIGLPPGRWMGERRAPAASRFFLRIPRIIPPGWCSSRTCGPLAACPSIESPKPLCPDDNVEAHVRVSVELCLGSDNLDGSFSHSGARMRPAPLWSMDKGGPLVRQQQRPSRTINLHRAARLDFHRASL